MTAFDSDDYPCSFTSWGLLGIHSGSEGVIPKGFNGFVAIMSLLKTVAGFHDALMDRQAQRPPVPRHQAMILDLGAIRMDEVDITTIQPDGGLCPSQRKISMASCHS